MFAKVTLLICLTAASSFAVPLSGRIVNGTDAVPGQIPYIVSLRAYGSHNCGGALLDPTHVLTAAHCVAGYQATGLSIQYGVTQIASGDAAPNVVQVSKITYNPDYKPGNGYYNDVAVLELAQAVTFSDAAQPISLPSPDEPTPGGCPATLAGWGLPYSGGSVMQNLQVVDIMVYSDDACEEAHANTGPTNRLYNICAGVPGGGKGQCNGDSGGPLVCKGKVVGAVSWSVKPCTVKDYPGVFAKISTQVNWIRAQL